jgi:hypothetical protein
MTILSRRLPSIVLSLALLCLAAAPARADWFVGNGGDAVYCEGGAFDGYFAYDFLVTFDGRWDAFLEEPSVEAYLAAIQLKLAAASPALGTSFADFVDQMYNTSFARQRIWQAAPFGLINIAGDDAVSLVPSECRVGHEIRVVQAVIRQPPQSSGLPADKILYRYVPDVTEGLATESPMQLSFLMVHEWLWDHTTDLKVIQRVTSYLHRKTFFAATPEAAMEELRGMGLGVGPSGVRPRRLAMTTDHGCFIKADTSIQCWGANAERQSTPPTNLQRPSQLAALEYHTCVADEAGVTCWGLFPQQRLATGVSRLSVSGYDPASHTYSVCFVHNGGRLACAGPLASHAPQDIRDFIDVAVSSPMFACGVSHSRGLVCFGRASSNEGQVPALTNVTSIHDTGDDALCAVADGRLRCWGAIDQTSTEGLPTLDPDDLIAVRDSTDEAFCGFGRRVRRLWCTSQDRVTPVVTEAPTLADADELLMAGNAACAASAGRVKCWGSGNVVDSLPPSIRLP